MDTLNNFYKGKKIFLTGHTGFKGSWLMLWLKSLGADVTGYALPAESLSLYNLVDGDTSCRSIIGDISDEKHLTKALHDSKADIVLHLAAQSLVRKSYDTPVETYRTNIMGSVYLLEAARTAPHAPKAIINVTSDKCYRNDGSGVPFKEADPLGGHDPYSSSKAASEIVTEAYRHSYSIPLASARAGNVIGGGDFALDRIIPDIIGAIKRGEPAIIRSPNAVRPWQHVLDALHGYLLLAEKLCTEGTHFTKGYNFGPADEALPVKILADHLLTSIGRGSYHIDPARANLYEAPMLRLDATLARKELSWKPAFDAKQAIDFTAKWYKEYLDSPENIQDYTLSQINHYMQRC